MSLVHSRPAGAEREDPLVRLFETPLAGAIVVEIDPIEDERGFFARLWSADVFAEHGLKATFAQSSISYNAKKGTLRGMHYQVDPHAETKLVRCTAGAVSDVIIDLRPGSETFTEHFQIELTRHNHRMLYVPEGFAHGFVTLRDDTEICYQISTFYSPQHARGVRWNDPIFGIEWPSDVSVISERDKTFPDFQPSSGQEGFR